MSANPYKEGGIRAEMFDAVGNRVHPKDSKFKPCPFCGSDHINFLEPSLLSRRRKSGNRAIRVACISCKSSTGDFDLYQTAQDAWNERIS